LSSGEGIATMTNRPSTEVRSGDATEERESRAAAACPECGGRVVREDDAERVCTDCGLVATEAEIDPGPEWRAYDARESAEKSRVGAPMSEMKHDRGLSTTISWSDRDDNGRLPSSRKRARLQRLRTWNERFRTRDARDRNLKHALGEIDRMASGLGVPDPTRETAGVVYRRALDEDLLPGRSIEGVATAALYAATRIDGLARTIEEVAAVSRVDSLEIKRTYRYVARELELHIPPTDPIEYVGRVASELDCCDETERRARELVDVATDRGIHSGKHPIGIAASALYAAGRLCNDRITQATLSEVADISEVTIRNRYREVLAAAEEDDGDR
jgi:transcription initiation factor TFIIB